MNYLVMNQRVDQNVCVGVWEGGSLLDQHTRTCTFHLCPISPVLQKAKQSLEVKLTSC